MRKAVQQSAGRQTTRNGCGNNSTQLNATVCCMPQGRV